MQMIRYLNGKKLNGAMPSLLLPSDSFRISKKEFPLSVSTAPVILEKEKSEGSVNDA